MTISLKWIHQGTCGATGSLLNIFADFDNYILKIVWEPREDATIDKGIEGTHQCSSLEELFKVYEENAAILFGEGSKPRFRDTDNDDIEPIDLERWYQLNWEPVDTTLLSKEEIEAMDILKKVLLKWDNNLVINNLVFYWGDDSSNAVYVNNRGFNSKTEALLKKHINNPKKFWLNGTKLEVTTVLIEDLVDNLDVEFSEIQKKVDQYMYTICAILESKRCFRLIETAKNFRAFSVWHDEEEKVDFKLRKKCKGMYQ